MKLVLTGGPSGGKTTMALALAKAFPDKVQIIAEAASILFGGGFRRSKITEGIRHQQQAIYRVQVEHEAIYDLEFPQHFIICDRGTLDGVAYWPKVDQDFFKSVNTTHEVELQRYQWVIHLDTADARDYDRSNELRREGPLEANHINQKVMKAWDGHPQRFIIPATESFAHKMTMTMTIVEQILLGCQYKQICKDVLCE